MKKLLLILFLTAFTSSYSFSQNYDLDFFYQINTGNADTVVLGQSYMIDGQMINYGPSAFADSIDFRVYVGLTAAGFNSNTTIENFGLNIKQFYAIPDQAIMPFHGQILISNDHFVPNSYNIVIIWPSDAYRDRNNANNYKIIRLFVKEASTKIADGMLAKKKENKLSLNDNSVQDKISFFPNPAADVLNVSVKNTETGTLKITDLSGRKISEVTINANNSSFIPMQLTKDGTKLPNGVYLLLMETANYREVKKFVILNK